MVDRCLLWYTDRFTNLFYLMSILGSSGATSANLVASTAAAAVAAAARLNGLMRTTSPPKIPHETSLAATNSTRISAMIAERRGSTSPPQQPAPPPASLLPGLLCGAKNPLQERLAEQMLRTMDHHQSALLSPVHQVHIRNKWYLIWKTGWFSWGWGKKIKMAD